MIKFPFQVRIPDVKIAELLVSLHRKYYDNVFGNFDCLKNGDAYLSFEKTGVYWGLLRLVRAEDKGYNFISIEDAIKFFNTPIVVPPKKQNNKISVNIDLDDIINYQKKLSANERMSFWRKLMKGYCEGCACEIKNCFCDEC